MSSYLKSGEYHPTLAWKNGFAMLQTKELKYNVADFRTEKHSPELKQTLRNRGPEFALRTRFRMRQCSEFFREDEND